MRILIAEDDVIPRRILQAAVERFGHECLVAEDGCQAWEIYQNNSIDVLISDRMMPGLEGIALCRQVRQAPHSGYTYFIFVTGLGEKEELLAGFQAGADDYLTKPLDSDELRMRLLVAARITALHRELAGQQVELQRLNQELFEQGRCDPLTRLGNRLRLMEDLVILAGGAERYGKRYCALMCDVDSFKTYNDHYGHLAGDQVLRTVAQTITKNCRAGDAAYRYGGDEFLIILPEQPAVDAGQAAERLRCAIQALALPHESKTPAGVLTISAGVAALEPDDHKAIHNWLKRADQALYRAKQEGRNRVAVDGA